ncbi:hypothetical protein [Paenibacillus sp. FSL R5-0473]|uniref:hypothetical protein n=1 Tax=Paenibacillus sp. FSL R5-0473 TaxID=2921642 RepID=UPI0030FB5080
MNRAIPENNSFRPSAARTGFMVRRALVTPVQIRRGWALIQMIVFLPQSFGVLRKEFSC